MLWTLSTMSERATFGVRPKRAICYAQRTGRERIHPMKFHSNDKRGDGNDEANRPGRRKCTNAYAETFALCVDTLHM